MRRSWISHRTCYAPLVLGSFASALAPTQPCLGAMQHRGPAVAPGEAGPQRFVDPLIGEFSVERALAAAGFADRFYRTPGGEGYEKTLEHYAARLTEAGFGRVSGLELVTFESEMEHPSWTPKSAYLSLRAGSGGEVVLHAFDTPEDVDRTMLPIFAPSAAVEGKAVFQLGDVQPGCVLVTEARANANLITRASERGAVAILSAAVNAFTVDPSGRERHLDAILFTRVPPETQLPVAQISQRSLANIQAAAEAGEVRLTLRAEVLRGSKKIRTLCATILGQERADEAIVIASHVQEPGAGDNASGSAGLIEGARTLAHLLQEKALAPPRRSIAFIWGDEFRQSQVWLEQSGRTAIAGISADMLGQSFAETGAIALLERMQDPGALVTLAPDEHTPWGAGKVSEEDIVPNGLALIARIALHDVAQKSGTWRTAENPWEGGSDHDVFLARGIPAILLWHFTDFTYHTSLDRMEMLDPEELKRSVIVVLATALAVAAPEPTDLGRYLESNELERKLRASVAEANGHSEIADRWELWCKGAEHWLRELCGGTGQ